MTEATQSVLQYGALGLLALVLFGVWKLVSMLADRIAKAFDSQAVALERVANILDKTETKAERRHLMVLQRIGGLNGHARDDIEDEDSEHGS
jgi:ABC-type nickel/cobalt efflux system permease component RcnA